MTGFIRLSRPSAPRSPSGHGCRRHQRLERSAVHSVSRPSSEVVRTGRCAIPAVRGMPTAEVVAERYAAAVEEFICEPPETIGTALALVEFSGVIAAETLLSRVLDNSGPVRMRPNSFHQAVALSAAAKRLRRVATDEWVTPTTRRRRHRPRRNRARRFGAP